MTEDKLSALVSRIRSSMNCSKDHATQYAADIGETPEVAHGKIMVRNSGDRIIACVPVSVLG